MRYVIIHMDRATIEDGLNAHAFGPFDSIEQAEAFDAEGAGDDTCVKLMVPIVGPGIFDMMLSTVGDRVVGVDVPEKPHAKAN